MKYLLLGLWLIVSTASAQSVKTYIPKNAYLYLPVMVKEQKQYFPDVPDTAYMPALTEHESCPSLTSKRCWSPDSELKTEKEQGVGLGQITRAYDKTGKVRMDALEDMKRRYDSELKELSWLTVKKRPDLQIRALVLMTRGNYKSLHPVKNPIYRLQMTDAAYNGGLGGLNKERMACGLAKDCDPQIWFDNVEKYCLKSKKALYGNRTPCDINRHHVDDVFNTRMPKYRPLVNAM